MKKIAVFGANGNLGREVVHAFGDAGWQVRAVTRDGKFAHDTHHDRGIETATADAMDTEQVIAASEGCEFIFNGINPPYTQWSKLCMPMARNMIAAARQHGAVHLFPGNVYNYGSTMPAVISDTTPFNADTKKGRIRVEMEEMFAQAAQKDNVRTIIVRAGDFFGSKRKAATWFDIAITKKLEKGKMTYPGPMETIHSWAYLPDFARVFVTLAEDAKGFDKFATFLFEGHAINAVQFKSALESVTGRSLKHQGMPWPIMRVIALFSPMLKEVCEMAYLWKVAHRLDPSKLAAQIGEVPHTPLEQALAQALVDQGKSSQLAKTAQRQIPVNA